MADAETGLEPTIEISDDDYPEIMRIMASDGEVDTYLASVGIEPDVFDGTEVDTTICAQERAALGGSLRFAVESAGEATGSLDSVKTIIVPVSTATALLRSLTEVTNEGLRLVDCLDDHRPEAADGLRETFELLALDDDRLRRAVDERSTGG